MGFVIGVAWPRLAGIHLAPAAPIDEGEAAPAAVASADAPAPPSAAPPPPAAKLAEAPAAPPTVDESSSQRVVVKESTITSCADSEGRKGKSCDSIAYNAILGPRIQALAECKAAEGVTGTLSLGFELDFKSGKVKGSSIGKSTTLSGAAARELQRCAASSLEQLSLAGVEHQFESYTVFYVAELLVPRAGASGAAPGAAPDITAASGQATVAWEAAIIRESPKDGKVVARILRGTRVVVTAKKDDWYRVRYDAKGSEGWVYRSAIGL